MTHRPHFNELHHTYLNETPVIHVYAEPYYTGQDSGSESEFEKSLAWFDKIKKTKQLIRKGFIEYIHPEVETENYYDICHIEKKTFDYENARVGQIYPAIIYTHNQTILTIATVSIPNIPTYPYELYIYYPCDEAKKDFEDQLQLFEKRSK